MNLHTRPTFERQFSEPDAASGINRDTEPSSVTAAKPIGSAAARFQIRSANTLQYGHTRHIQVEKNQVEDDRSKEGLMGFYESNKSKSLDWRGTKTRHGNTTEISFGTSELGQNLVKHTESLHRQEASNKITSYTENNQPNSFPWRIQGYGVTGEEDRKVYPNSGFTPVRMNRVTLAMEQTGSGQSLPLRLKPRLSQGNIEEGLWTQHGEHSPDLTDNKIGFWAREQVHSNTEEVTGNQTIMERIEKLFGSSSSDSSHLNSDTILRHRKSSTELLSGPQSPSDSQPRRPLYTLEKAGTFPRRCSKTEQTFFDKMQEPSTLEIRNDQSDDSPGVFFSKHKWSTETSSSKKFQAFPPIDNEEKSKIRSLEFCSRPLERTRSNLSETDHPSGQRTHAQVMLQSTFSDGPSNISNQSVKHLAPTSGGVKKEIEKEEPTQPKYPTDNFSTLKAEERRGDDALEKSPSSESVKNTIHKFEALAQQNQGAQQIIRARRALSVPEQPKPVVHVKKSDSDINLKFRRVVGNTEMVRTNPVSKDDAGKVPESNLDLNKTPQLNPIFQPSSEQRLKMYTRSVDVNPTFKQLHEPKPHQHISTWDENKRMVPNRYTDEPDLAIVPRTGLPNTGTIGKKARIPTFQPTVSQQSNVNRLVKQQSIHLNMYDNDDDDDDDDDDTPTNSPDSSSLTINMQSNTVKPQTSAHTSGISTSVKATANGTKAATGPVQKMYSSFNNSNNNNYNTTRNDPGKFVTSKARWSSDEEDYDDDDEDYEGMDSDDSDSGESSVTVTSNMSQSDRRSFSLSFVELCIYGGVDYKPSDGSVSEDGEDWSPSRSASLSSDISVFSSVTLLSSHELDRLMDDVKNLGDDTLQNYEDVQVVVLHKEVGSGLGFTLAGGVDQNKPVTVHKVIPGGVAAQEGSIYEGAWVLSINGTSLQKCAHWEALRTLRKARSQTMAVVVLQSSNQNETQETKEAIYRPVNTGKRVHVTLNKSGYDLGFSLEGGVDSSSGDKPLTVQKIFQGGPVNEVFPGDELWEVQGQSLMDMRRIEAWNLIRRLPSGPVEILLYRPHQPH